MKKKNNVKYLELYKAKKNAEQMVVLTCREKLAIKLDKDIKDFETLKRELKEELLNCRHSK